MTWSNCIIEGWIFIKPFGYTTYQTFIVYRSNIAEYNLKVVMRCKCDILSRSLDMKPEPFLDSNLCVVKDDYSGDTAEMLKCTDQCILKAFDRLQCFPDFLYFCTKFPFTIWHTKSSHDCESF